MRSSREAGVVFGFRGIWVLTFRGADNSFKDDRSVAIRKRINE